MNLITELVIANRILANEDVVDAYGHVSVRNPEAPEHFFLAHSRSPALVEAGDIVEHHARRAAAQARPAAAVPRALHPRGDLRGRPEVMAVVHAHAEDVLPFTITRAPLRPVIHSGAFIGAEVPVWDIAERFGDRTNLLVTDMAQGRDLAKRLGGNSVALMRGHGFAAAARSLIDVVRLSVYLPRNARVQFKAMQIGELKPLSAGEIQARAAGTGYKPQSPETQRAWQYWAQRAGCGDLLES